MKQISLLFSFVLLLIVNDVDSRLSLNFSTSLNLAIGAPNVVKETKQSENGTIEGNQDRELIASLSCPIFNDLNDKFSSLEQSLFSTNIIERIFNRFKNLAQIAHTSVEKFIDVCHTPLPEESLNTIGLIKYHGYPAEIHKARTSDGYILTLHRIPNGSAKKVSTSLLGKASGNTPKPVVFLQHGLLDSSASWVINSPEQSLAFILADAGFDVWMGNVRGNKYSREHAEFPVSNPLRSGKRLQEKENGFKKSSLKKFFNWDQMAEYDLPAMVDFVLEKTNSTKLFYVGHSQETTIMFAKLASNQEFAKKIRAFYALAPVASVSNIEGSILAWGGKFVTSSDKANGVVFGEGEFLPNTHDILGRFGQHLCRIPPLKPVCMEFLEQLGGSNTNRLNTTRLSVYFAHILADTSNRNMHHWTQMVHTDKERPALRKYKFRSESENLAKYNASTPPEYDLSKVAAPVHLFYSDDDRLAGKDDVKFLLEKLPKVWRKAANTHNLNRFNHFDMIWAGAVAEQEIYEKIVESVSEESVK